MDFFGGYPHLFTTFAFLARLGSELTDLMMI
jgi:hypothetical protein